MARHASSLAMSFMTVLLLNPFQMPWRKCAITAKATRDLRKVDLETVRSHCRSIDRRANQQLGDVRAGRQRDDENDGGSHVFRLHCAGLTDVLADGLAEFWICQTFGHFGRRGAGFDDTHADTVAADFLAHSFGHRRERKLARGVRAEDSRCTTPGRR